MFLFIFNASLTWYIYTCTCKLRIFQPTTQVFKAGYPVSYSFVVVRSFHLMEVSWVSFSPFFLLVCYTHIFPCICTYMYIYMYIYACTLDIISCLHVKVYTITVKPCFGWTLVKRNGCLIRTTLKYPEHILCTNTTLTGFYLGIFEGGERLMTDTLVYTCIYIIKLNNSGP